MVSGVQDPFSLEARSAAQRLEGHHSLSHLPVLVRSLQRSLVDGTAHGGNRTQTDRTPKQSNKVRQEWTGWTGLEIPPPDAGKLAASPYQHLRQHLADQKARGPRRNLWERAAVANSGAAEAQLLALMQALAARQDSLPECVRDLVHSHQENSASAQAKALRKRVATQAAATKQLASLRLRRSQYLVSWKEYVQKLSDCLDEQLQEKADVMAGFDAEESTFQDTIETAKATVLSLAGKEVSVAGETALPMEVATAEPSVEEREKLKKREESLLQAVKLMKQDVEIEVAARVKSVIPASAANTPMHDVHMLKVLVWTQ